MHRLNKILLLLGVLLLAVAISLPPAALSWLRRDFRTFGRVMNWIDSVPYVDMTHVIMFAFIAFAYSCCRLQSALRRQVVPLLALALISELAQFFVPGRSPLLHDFIGDVIGSAIGLALAGVLKFLFQIREKP